MTSRVLNTWTNSKKEIGEAVDRGAALKRAVDADTASTAEQKVAADEILRLLEEAQTAHAGLGTLLGITG